MAKLAFRVGQAMTGDVSIYYARPDTPVMHVVAQAPHGTMFQVAEHFEKCPVCKKFGVTEDDFATFMQSLGAGPFIAGNKGDA